MFNEKQPNGSWQVKPAHRYSFRLRHGRDCDEQVNHHCDVRLCVNPDHFYEGDQKMNMRDARVRGRIGAPPAKRVRAHLMREAGFSSGEIAEEFEVHDSTVRRWAKAWQLEP